MNRKRWWLAVKNNWLILVGAVLAIIFVYSDFFLGDYYVSFTNLMYSVTPWSSSGIGVDGPVLSDVIDSFYPDMYTTITDGTFFGFWNPNVALGTTSDISSWMYPLNYWYLLPLTIATLCRTLSEFLLAFVGMYLLMKVFGCKKSISVITGVCYCFSSVIVMWLGWQHSDVAALAPFAFFFFEKFLRDANLCRIFFVFAGDLCALPHDLVVSQNAKIYLGDFCGNFGSCFARSNLQLTLYDESVDFFGWKRLH